MIRRTPRFGGASTQLPRELRARFDRAFEAEGAQRLASRLGTSEHVVNRLVYGGTAKADTVARVAARLAEAS